MAASPGEWLLDDRTYTTSVMSILLDRWGALDFIEWDPLTINLQLRDEFGIEANETLMDKIGAASALFSTNTFFIDFETFNSVSNVLNLGVTSSSLMLPADLDDALWACTEAKLLLGDLYDDSAYSHDVARYVGFLLTQDGVRNPPPILRFAEYDERGDANTRENTQDEAIHLAYWRGQQEDREMLDQRNRERLADLFDQIAELPIKGMNKQWITEKQRKVHATLSPS